MLSTPLHDNSWLERLPEKLPRPWHSRFYNQNSIFWNTFHSLIIQFLTKLSLQKFAGVIVKICSNFGSWGLYNSKLNSYDIKFEFWVKMKKQEWNDPLEPMRNLARGSKSTQWDSFHINPVKILALFKYKEHLYMYTDFMSLIFNIKMQFY